MDWSDVYKSKVVSAEEAVRVIRSGDWVDYGSICGQVRSLDLALAARKDELEDVKVWSLLTLSPPKILEVDPTGETFTWNVWHFSGLDREMANRGVPAYYAPIRYSELPRYVRSHIEPLNVAMLQVAPMDKHGYFNLGPQNSHCRAVCERAQIVIVEVNTNQPRCLGGYHEAIHISEINFVVEGANHPLPSLPPSQITSVDQKVAAFIMEELVDGACIQLGIGSMPSAVGEMIAESDLKNLGCHTEMLCDAHLKMFQTGKLNGKLKTTDPGRMAYTFALGSQELYNFIDDNPICASYPVDYINRPFLAALNDNLITVNNAIEVDLYGQVCSESIGTRHISGTGGQLDFVIAGYESRGGKSFICLSSYFTGKDGQKKSRIVPTLTPGAVVTAPRSIAHFVVSEYGKLDLKGKTVWQRAEGLINLAHPDLRDELVAAARQQGIWRRSNKHE